MSSGTEQAYQQIIRQQQLRIAELENRVEELTAQVARLLRNSSKPPSSDIVNGWPALR